MGAYRGREANLTYELVVRPTQESTCDQTRTIDLFLFITKIIDIVHRDEWSHKKPSSFSIELPGRSRNRRTFLTSSQYCYETVHKLLFILNDALVQKILIVQNVRIIRNQFRDCSLVIFQIIVTPQIFEIDASESILIINSTPRYKLKTLYSFRSVVL